MEAIPRNDGEQYRFDAFCKAVLRNEARNYHRNKKRLLDREKSFSVLSLEELGQLTSVDHAEKVNGVWEQRLRIHYNCVGTIEIPSALPLPTPDVSVNTRKGVVVNYAPCDVAI